MSSYYDSVRGNPEQPKKSEELKAQIISELEAALGLAKRMALHGAAARSLLERYPIAAAEAVSLHRFLEGNLCDSFWGDAIYRARELPDNP